MQERVMTTQERLRLKVMEELTEGRINGTTAANKLDLSVRQVKRLKQVYLKKGHEGLMHRSRGMSGTRKTNRDLENTAVGIIRNTYHDFGPTLVWEKLHDVHQIKMSDETVRQIMIRNNLWSSKKRKRGQYFAWRERLSSYGELVQFDGSYHNWFEGRNPLLPETCLLASIDDATGKITKARMGENESVDAVFSFWKDYVKVNDIPASIYLDKFSTYKINHPKAADNKELMTQFGSAAKELGIQLIFANSPQAKGRVERLFQTLQDRLVKEMRLTTINTIEAANIFLQDTFIPWFNNRYAVVPKSKTDVHRKLDTKTKRCLLNIFAKHYQRTIHNDFTIQFENNWYQLKEIQPTTVFKGDAVCMEERLDRSIHIKYKDHYLNFLLLPEKPKRVNESPIILTEHKSHWIPPKDHPWRQSIINYGV